MRAPSRRRMSWKKVSTAITHRSATGGARARFDRMIAGFDTRQREIDAIVGLARDGRVDEAQSRARTSAALAGLAAGPTTSGVDTHDRCSADTRADIDADTPRETLDALQRIETQRAQRAGRREPCEPADLDAVRRRGQRAQHHPVRAAVPQPGHAARHAKPRTAAPAPYADRTRRARARTYPAARSARASPPEHRRGRENQARPRTPRRTRSNPDRDEDPTSPRHSGASRRWTASRPTSSRGRKATSTRASR